MPTPHPFLKANLEAIEITTDLLVSSPLVSKISEKIINKKISIYFENVISKFMYGFRKGYNTQQSPLLMCEKWKNVVDNGKVFGALLTDLSEDFDWP